MIKESQFLSTDGKVIALYKWEIVNPKACVQIIHGMGEYAKRYDAFAEFLNKEGYSVYADDHRGHGATLESLEHHGQIGTDGFNKMVEDEFCLSKIIKSENPNKKLYILGHSMGSFILQEYLIKYSTFVDKAIISGSCGKMGLDLSLGKLLAYAEMKLRKEIKGSRLIDFLNFGLYSIQFRETKLKNAWLNRDTNEVKKYNNDPYCGNIFPAQFYYYLYKGIKGLHIEKRVKNIDKNLEIFIFSGDKDPVGKMGKGVKKLHNMYKKLDLKKIELKLYKEGRHEMLHEINKKEVFNDVLNFLNN